MSDVSAENALRSRGNQTPDPALAACRLQEQQEPRLVWKKPANEQVPFMESVTVETDSEFR